MTPAGPDDRLGLASGGPLMWPAVHCLFVSQWETQMNSRSGGVGIVGVIVIVLVILFLVGVIKL